MPILTTRKCSEINHPLRCAVLLIWWQNGIEKRKKEFLAVLIESQKHNGISIRIFLFSMTDYRYAAQEKNHSEFGMFQAFCCVKSFGWLPSGEDDSKCRIQTVFWEV